MTFLSTRLSLIPVVLSLEMAETLMTNRSSKYRLDPEKLCRMWRLQLATFLSTYMEIRPASITNLHVLIIMYVKQIFLTVT